MMSPAANHMKDQATTMQRTNTSLTPRALLSLGLLLT